MLYLGYSLLQRPNPLLKIMTDKPGSNSKESMDTEKLHFQLKIGIRVHGKSRLFM